MRSAMIAIGLAIAGLILQLAGHAQQPRGGTTATKPAGAAGAGPTKPQPGTSQPGGRAEAAKPPSRTGDAARFRSEPRALASGRGAKSSPNRAPGTYVTLQTGQGAMVLRMLPEDAPQTVANFVGLAEGTKPFKDPRSGRQVKRPFYDGLTFHRVMRGFMIQGGCPKGDGTGGPGYTIPDERPGLRPYVRGAVLMSNRGRPNSAGSQFFILQADVRDHLPRGYVVFGEVVEGIEVVDRIAAMPVKPNRFRPNERSTPVRPVAIKRAVVTRVG